MKPILRGHSLTDFVIISLHSEAANTTETVEFMPRHSHLQLGRAEEHLPLRLAACTARHPVRPQHDGANSKINNARLHHHEVALTAIRISFRTVALHRRPARSGAWDPEYAKAPIPIVAFRIIEALIDFAHCSTANAFGLRSYGGQQSPKGDRRGNDCQLVHDSLCRFRGFRNDRLIARPYGDGSAFGDLIVRDVAELVVEIEVFAIEVHGGVPLNLSAGGT